MRGKNRKFYKKKPNFPNKSFNQYSLLDIEYSILITPAKSVNSHFHPIGQYPFFFLDRHILPAIPGRNQRRGL